MSKYYVRDTTGYVTVVEAANYSTVGQTGTFEFFTKEGGKAASFPCHVVVSVVEADAAFKDIFPNEETETDEPETDDVCLDCRFEELLDSDAFFEAVTDVIDAYCCPEETVDSGSEEETLPVLTVLKATKTENGEVEYGFITNDGFVNFSTLDSAVHGLTMYLADTQHWSYADTSDYTFEEVTNG